jgi:hypothetical protein
MAKKQKRWIYSPPKPKPPEGIKTTVKAKADDLVETVLKPQHIKPPPEDMRWNYVVDIYTKWHGSFFYFCAKYANPRPGAIASHFETRFARLEYVAKDRFHLSYMRHTGKWWQVYPDLSLDECLDTIEDDPLFMP